MRRGKWFIVLAVLVLASACSPTKAEQRRHALALERERTRQTEAAVAAEQAWADVDKIREKYNGKAILAVVDSQNYVVRRQTDALTDLATFEMRKQQSWHSFWQALAIVVALIVLALVMANLEAIKTVVILRLGGTLDTRPNS